jgi:hypothetical protein
MLAPARVFQSARVGVSFFTLLPPFDIVPLVAGMLASAVLLAVILRRYAGR